MRRFNFVSVLVVCSSDKEVLFGNTRCPPAPVATAQGEERARRLHKADTVGQVSPPLNRALVKTMLDVIFSSRLLATVHAIPKTGPFTFKRLYDIQPPGVSNVRPAAWIRPVNGVFAARKMIFAKYKNGNETAVLNVSTGCHNIVAATLRNC